MPESQPPSLDHRSAMPESSLAARMVNVFVSPGEVFDEVKASPPRPANWVVPMALVMVVGIISTLVVFSQGQVLRYMHEAYEKQFQKMVDSGKMTQKAADQELALVEKIMSPALFKALGILAAVFGAAAMLCLTALFIWIIGVHVFHGEFDFVKTLEVVALANMISVLGAIIGMFLVVIYGSVYINVGPTLFLSHVDPVNEIHQLLLAINVMTLWYLAVLALGLSRLSRASFWKSAACIFCAWVVIKFTPMLLQALLHRLFTGGK